LKISVSSLVSYLMTVLLYLTCTLTLTPTLVLTQSLDNLILTESQKVFATKDGSQLSSLSYEITETIKQQIGKTLGIPAILQENINEWNMTTLRNLDDETLIRLALLATIGNFTTGQVQNHWEQPCQIVMDAKTGRLQVKDDRETMDKILKVLVLVFCALELRWILKEM